MMWHGMTPDLYEWSKDSAEVMRRGMTPDLYELDKKATAS